MKTAIVTGATGFIGIHLCKELLETGVAVTALVRSDSANCDRLPKSVRIVYCGMDDFDTLAMEPADTFFHLAWEGATGPGRDDESLQMKNVTRTIDALKAAKRIGCKRFVGLGTVYEKLIPQILTEPIHRKADFYLLAKQNAHAMCLKLSQKLEIEFAWATIFQPIGRYIKKEQVMAYTVDCLLKNVVPQFGPAMEPYDITAVEDIAYGLRLLGEKNLSQAAYYIGSGTPKRMKEYLVQTKQVLDVDTELGIGNRQDDGLRFAMDWYDISDLEKDTGYHARVSFEEAVKHMTDWMKAGE